MNPSFFSMSGKNRPLRPAGEADFGPAERWQHSGRVLEATGRAGILAARALEESVLDVLVLKRWISAVQREAALRLKRDFQAAGLSARLAMGYNPIRTAFSPFGPWDERTEAEEAAYQRWRKALAAVGMIDSDVVVTVVCYDIMPGSRRVEALRKGLGKLAAWYGLA